MLRILKYSAQNISNYYCGPTAHLHIIVITTLTMAQGKDNNLHIDGGGLENSRIIFTIKLKDSNYLHRDSCYSSAGAPIISTRNFLFDGILTSLCSYYCAPKTLYFTPLQLILVQGNLKVLLIKQ